MGLHRSLAGVRDCGRGHAGLQPGHEREQGRP